MYRIIKVIIYVILYDNVADFYSQPLVHNDIFIFGINDAKLVVVYLS